MTISGGSSTGTRVVTTNNQYGDENGGGLYLEVICPDNHQTNCLTDSAIDTYTFVALSKGNQATNSGADNDTNCSAAGGGNGDDPSECFVPIHSVAAPVMSVTASPTSVVEGAAATFTISAGSAPNHYNDGRTARIVLPITFTVGDNDMVLSGSTTAGSQMRNLALDGADITVPVMTQASGAGEITLTLTAATGYSVAAAPGDAATVTVSELVVAAPTVTQPTSFVNTLNERAFPISGTTAADTAVNITIADANSANTVTAVATVTGTDWTATVNLSSLNDGGISISAIASVGARESVEGVGAAAKDTEVPTVTIGGPATVAMGRTIETTFSLSEAPGASTAFEIGDVTATGGTLAAALGGAGTEFTVDFTGMTAGTNGVITVAANAFTDAAGNPSAGATHTITVTDLPATATPVIGANTPTAGSLVGEAGADSLTVAGTTVTGATVTVTATSSAGGTPVTEMATVTTTNWTATLDISGLEDGDITITATAQVTGSALSEEATRMVELDTVATVTISGSTALVVDTTTTITFTLSDTPASPSAFDDADVSITGDAGTLSAVTGSGTNYTATFTAGSTDATAIITVRDNAYTDAAGNTSDEVMHTIAVNTLPASTVPVINVPVADAYVNVDNEAAFTISGTATAGADIAVSITSPGDTTVNETTTATGGIWSVTPNLSGFTEDNIITISVTATEVSMSISPTATVAVRKDAEPPTVSFSNGPMTLLVGNTSTLDITTTEVTTDFAEGDITITNGTLVAGSFSGSGTDYTVSFVGGTNVGNTVTISVGANTFTDEAGNDNTASATPFTVVLDGPATLTANAPTAEEGNALGFVLSLSKESLVSVVVSYATSDGTATAGTDYTAATGTVTFAPSITTRNVSVVTADDSIYEGSTAETVMLVISEPMNVSLGTNDPATLTATGSITDNEDPPVISLAATAAATEGTNDSLDFVVTLEQSSLPASVAYATSDGTATAGMDYTDTSGTLSFAVGETMKTISVPVLDDGDYEPADENMTLVLSSPVNSSFAAGSTTAINATGTITSDDSLMYAVTNDAEVSEGGNLVFVVTRNGDVTGSAEDIMYSIDLTGDVEAADFSGGSNTGTVRIPVGERTATFTVTTNDDTTREGDEAFTVELTAMVDGVEVTGSGTSTIVDNDIPAVRITATEVAIDEGGSVEFTITGALPGGGLNEDVTVPLTLVSNGDFFAAGTAPPTAVSVTLNTANPSATLTYATVDDEDNEDDGFVTATITANSETPPAYTLGTPSTASVLIEDNDGLNEEEVATINLAILPYIGATTVDILGNSISQRIENAFTGTSTGGSGLTISGSSAADYLFGQLQSRHNQREQMRASGQWKADEAFKLNPHDISFVINLGGGSESASATNASANTTNAIGAAINATGTSTNLPAFSANTFQDRGTGSGSRVAGPVDGITLWGRGFYHDMDGIKNAVDYEGTISGGMFGLDVLKGNLVLGAALSDTKSEIDFTFDDLLGIHTTNMTGINPYFGYRWDNDAQLWGTLGYAGGDVTVHEINDTTDRYTSDLTMTSASLGGYAPVFSRVSSSGNSISLGVIGSGLIADMNEGNVQVNAGRVRVGLKLQQSTSARGGYVFSSNASLNYRQDFGDSFTGGGVEVGGGLALDLPSSGVRLDINARTLVSHSDEVNEWGADIGIAWTARADGTGFSLSFKPQWGAMNSQEQRFWDTGTTNFTQSGTNIAGHYNLEMKYGIQTTRDKLIELFATGDENKNLTLGATFALTHAQGKDANVELFARSATALGQNLTLGANYALGETLSIGYEATLISEAITIPEASGTPLTAPDAIQQATARYLPYLRQSTPELSPFGPGSNLLLPGLTGGTGTATPGLTHQAYLRYERRF
ncbi:MAG: beta strand repeat-containing protein [Pseudohongiellaceae bacterium]